MAGPTGGITEKHEVRCCRHRCGAGCCDKLFRGRSGDAVGAPLDMTWSVWGMFFITVNQVLVRLWARRGRMSDRMWSVSCEGFSWGRGPPATVAMCSEASVVC